MYRVLVLLFAGVSLSICDFEVSFSCVPDDVGELSGSTNTWTFTSDQTKETHRLNDTGNTLKFRYVNNNDSGQYKCLREGYKGENRVRLTRTFTIKLEAPSPVEEWQVIRVEAGNNAMLPCKVDQILSPRENEPPPVVWKREKRGGGDVILNPDKYNEDGKSETSQRVFWDISPEFQDWAIKISQTTEEDAGMYKCVITNTSQTLLVELEVIAPPPPRCLGHTDPWEACLDPNSRSGKAILQESLREFSTAVYSHLKGSKAKTNLIFSPFSIAAAFYNLLLGARGETRTQLENALKLPPKFACVHSAAQKLKKAMKDSLATASGIFYNPDLQLSEAFTNQSQDFYHTVPHKLTNDSNLNVQLINNWVAEKTNNRITELNSEVDSATSFVLLNAVYFTGKWKTVFEATNKKEKFLMFSGVSIDVPTLYSSKYNLQMGYSKELKAEVGRFPLTGKNSLYILIPQTVSEEAFISMENNLNHRTMTKMVAEIVKTPIQTAEVTLPKIKLTLTKELVELLRDLGLSDLFLSPNLCGMFQNDTGSFISDVRHRAFLSLTEKGVEAAAATSISFSRSLASFTALQPFVLIVWSDEAAAPLFMGRIINPEK